MRRVEREKLEAAGPFNIIGEDLLSEVVSKWTSVPLSKIKEEQFDQCFEIEADLHRRVIGQKRAVTALAKALRRSRLGVGDSTKPVASFLFIGPTGVGKTELAKALADFFFGGSKFLLRFDMTEYMERHAVGRFIGSPPGYAGYLEGGQLTDAIRRKPNAVVLFDEAEKAHPDIFSLFLQIMEDARLTDGQGRTVSFRGAIVLLTVNIGSRVIIEEFARSIGTRLVYVDTDFSLPEYSVVSYQNTENISHVKVRKQSWYIPEVPQDAVQKDFRYEKIKDVLKEDHLKWYFKPEFLNRLDDFIIFLPLYEAEVKEVAQLMIKGVIANVEKIGIRLRISQEVENLLLKGNGYDINFGVRPLRRLIASVVETAVADAVLEGEIKKGDEVTMEVVEMTEKTAFRFTPVETKVDPTPKDEDEISSVDLANKSSESSEKNSARQDGSGIPYKLARKRLKELKNQG